MVLAQDAVSIFGMAVGFALWLGLIYVVHRWGPFEDEPPEAPAEVSQDLYPRGR
jgi:hypothetical protein